MVAHSDGVPVQRITLDDSRVVDRWPFTLPVVKEIHRHGLELNPGATIILGANGSGKSTIIEALAAAWARRARGKRNDWLLQAVTEPSHEDSDLHQALRLDCTRAGGQGGMLFRAERIHAQASLFEHRGRWQEHLAPAPVLTQSHGEGFLQLLAGMTAEPGLYVLDEPESALSYDSNLVLVNLMADMVAAGSQLVLATHSPILAALPGATLLEFTTSGFGQVSYEQADVVTSWRAFLEDPNRYFRHLRRPAGA